MTSAEEQPVWAYWLAHFCLPVWGDDLTLKLPVVTLNREIIHGINGDFPVLVRTNLMQLQKSPPLTEIRRIKRETARRLLRATARCGMIMKPALTRCRCRRWPEKP